MISPWVSNMITFWPEKIHRHFSMRLKPLVNLFVHVQLFHPVCSCEQLFFSFINDAPLLTRLLQTYNTYASSQECSWESTRCIQELFLKRLIHSCSHTFFKKKHTLYVSQYWCGMILLWVIRFRTFVASSVSAARRCLLVWAGGYPSTRCTLFPVESCGWWSLYVYCRVLGCWS